MLSVVKADCIHHVLLFLFYIIGMIQTVKNLYVKNNVKVADEYQNFVSTLKCIGTWSPAAGYSM